MDHCDTPHRKFLLMIKVFSLKQMGDESVRAYGARFQRMRRQASLEDGVMLILAFFNGLRLEIRKAASLQISARFGNELPSTLESIIQLVSSNDDDFLSASRSSGTSSVKDTSRKRKSTDDNKDHERSNKSSSSIHHRNSTCMTSGQKKECRYCKKTWFKGHKCDEFHEYHDKNRQQQRVSRMAYKTHGRHSNKYEEHPMKHHDDDDNDSVISGELSHMSLEGKLSRQLIKRDFKHPITNNNVFPLLINSRIKAFALLDTGANFSSIDKSMCIKHNLRISYITPSNKKLSFDNKNNNDHFIRLADSDKYVERIGTCELSISCNNKTITKIFEVMNLTTDQDEYMISIGTDYMHLIGIGYIWFTYYVG